jgi:hypothetical protein
MKPASGTISRQIRINHMQILNRTSLPSEQIESHLPEEGINGIFGKPGEAGAKSIVVQVA